MLSAELDRLVEHLTTLNRPVVGWLLPGVDAHHVSSALGFPVPPSVAQWFGWCNGVAESPGQLQDDVNVVPGYNPVSVEEAVRMMPDYAGDPLLGSHWVPLLRSGGGDIYAATWSADKEAAVAGVLIGEPTEVEFTGIEQMVSVFNQSFAQRAYYVEQGRLTMDPELYDEVYAQVIEGGATESDG